MEHAVAVLFDPARVTLIPTAPSFFLQTGSPTLALRSDAAPPSGLGWGLLALFERQSSSRNFHLSVLNSHCCAA